jgi:hypothetical protein
MTPSILGRPLLEASSFRRDSVSGFRCTSIPVSLKSWPRFCQKQLAQSSSLNQFEVREAMELPEGERKKVL